MAHLLVLVVLSLVTTVADGQMRTWTDSTGQFSIQAEFAGAAMGQAKLRKASGETISIPIDRLSEADRKWLEDRKRRVPEAKPAEPLSPKAVLERLLRQAKDNPHLAGCIRSLFEAGSPSSGMSDTEKKAYADKIAAALQQGEAQRKELVRQEKERPRTPNMSQSSRAAAKKRAKQLEECKGVYLPAMYGLKIGRIGRMYDPDTPNTYQDSLSHLRYKLRIIQIISPTDMLVSQQNRSDRFWLKGLSTQGLADGNVIGLERLMEVTGTTTYKTVLGGSKTIFVVEPLKLDPVDFIGASREAGVLQDWAKRR